MSTQTLVTPHDYRPAGIAGWAGTVMLFTGVILISSTGTPEPQFDGSAEEIKRYLETQSPTAVAVGGFLLAFGLCALLWFISGLSAAVRRLGAGPEWLPTVVLASGVAAIAPIFAGAPQAAAFRGPDGLDAQVARLAFDLGSMTFANMWVALGSLSLASGWAILAGRVPPGSVGSADSAGSAGGPRPPGDLAWPAWLGWWAVAVGVGFLVVRMAFPTYLWVVPYLPFWVWILVVSTRMLRARARS